MRRDGGLPAGGIGKPSAAQQLQHVGPFGRGEHRRVVEDGGEVGEGCFVLAQRRDGGGARLVGGGIDDRHVRRFGGEQRLETGRGGRRGRLDRRQRGGDAEPRTTVAPVESDQQRATIALAYGERELRGRLGQCRCAQGALIGHRGALEGGGDRRVVDEGGCRLDGGPGGHGARVGSLGGGVGGDEGGRGDLVGAERAEGRDDVRTGGAGERPVHPAPGTVDGEQFLEARVHRVARHRGRCRAGGRARCGRCGRGGRSRCGRGGGGGIRDEIRGVQVGLQRRRCQRSRQAGVDLGRDVGIAELQREAFVGQALEARQPRRGTRGRRSAQRADRRRDGGVDREDRTGAVDRLELGGELTVGRGEREQLVGGQQTVTQRRRRDRNDDPHRDGGDRVVRDDQHTRGDQRIGADGGGGTQRVDPRRPAGHQRILRGHHHARRAAFPRLDRVGLGGAQHVQFAAAAVAGQPAGQCGTVRQRRSAHFEHDLGGGRLGVGVIGEGHRQ